MPTMVHLEVAARLKTDTVLPGLYRITLDCTAGGCSLLRIALNECRVYGREQDLAFVPTAERSTTWEQTLTVQAAQSALLVEEAVSDSLASESKINYRFEYTKPAAGSPVMRLT